jgi:hypothetical protein
MIGHEVLRGGLQLFRVMPRVLMAGKPVVLSPCIPNAPLSRIVARAKKYNTGTNGSAAEKTGFAASKDEGKPDWRQERQQVALRQLPLRFSKLAFVMQLAPVHLSNLRHPFLRS